MRDLDFDELDRAVNSLITNQGGGNPVSPDEQTGQVAQIAQPLNSANISPRPVAARPTLNSISAKPLVPNRPATGRFMDMVRTNPDPKVASSAIKDTVPNNLGASTTLASPVYQPMQPTVPVTQQVVMIQPVPIATPIQPEVLTVPTTSSALPNPVVVSDDEDSDIDRISNEINQTLGQPYVEQPQDSPFISGAKVEKRPLNAFTAPIVEPSPAPAVNPTTLSGLSAAESAVGMSTYEDNLKAEKERFAQLNTPLPAELQSDILSIESRETIQSDDYDEPMTVSSPVNVSVNAQPIPVAAVAAETPAIATPSSPVQTNPIVANSTPSSAGNVAVNVNASIKPQYTEQPSTGDKTNGAIYDTKSYHKAMNGSGKIKANLMLAFWAFLLVLVSVGAGIAVFTFVLPNL